MEISSQKPDMLQTKLKFMLRAVFLMASLFASFVTFSKASELRETQVNEGALESFEAKYKAYRFGRELGYANLQLEDLGREKYRLTYDSKVSLFFLSDKRKETSLFSFKDDQILPYKYSFKRSGTGSNKSLEARFDEQSKQITLNQDNTIPWQGELDNQLYRLDVQLKLANGESEFEYSLLNYRGELRHYKLQVMGKEQLDLPYGMLEGIKVKIIRENKKRETFAWFSPELNYQLVRLQQFKEGEEQGDIQLSEYILKSAPQTASVK